MAQLHNHKDKEAQREFENVYQSLANAGSGSGDMLVATYDPNAIAQDLYAGTGTAAPTTTPDYIGQKYVDTTNLNVYLASETNGSYNWAFVGKGESSDFNQDTVANIFEWWKADEGVTKDGGDLVSSWADVVSGHAVIMTVNADKPDYLADGMNGHPALRFENTNSNLLSNTPNSGTQWTGFIVATLDEIQAGLKIWCDTGANSSLRTTGNLLRFHTYVDYGTYSIGEKFITVFRTAGGTSGAFVRKNNNAEVMVAASWTQSKDRQRFGENWAGGYNLKCHIPEAIYYNAYLTEENIQKVLTYLNNKYAIY